jgi:DNA-binding transcriptional ArsR family regulator
MCIALAPCAAGEGDSHPQKIEPLFTDTTNLPWIILRAVHRAARLDGVSTRARAVLAALARTVDAAKPFGEIYARRTLLSERAMQSERTFYRSLADLEAAGLIDRAPQRRYVEAGLFGRAYLYLTQKAAVLLGLIEEPTVQSISTDLAQASSTKAKRFEPPHANVADGANTKDLSPLTFQKRQPGQVPQDLQRLRSLGFLDFLIFKLMREAREAGKRLSDVVEVCWQHLRQAKRPINYLRALLTSTTDFGHQMRAKAAALAETQAVEAARLEAEATVKALDGRSFVDVLGQTRYTVTDHGTTLTVRSIDGVTRQAAGQWSQGFIRALRGGQISEETLSNITAVATSGDHRHLNIERRLAATPRALTVSAAEHLTKLRALCGRA